VKVYTDREGLPQNTIWALTQDRDGMLWAGTLHGIARYDGRGWVSMATPVPPASVLVNPNAAACLADGSLCFGTRNHGVLVYRQGAWSCWDRTTGLPSDNINAIVESSVKGRDGEPILWVGSFGGGVARREAGRWEPRPIPGGPGTERVYALMEVRNAEGRPELWAGTHKGVWIHGILGWRAFALNSTLPGTQVRALASADSGPGRRIWFGLEEGGIVEWDGDSLRRHNPTNGLPTGAVHALLAGSQAPGGWSLWAAVGDQAPVLLQNGVWSSGDLGDSPSLRFSRSLLASEHPGTPRILWVGTEGRGLARWVEGGWRHLPFPGKEEDPRVLSLLEGREPGPKSLWLSTQAGGVWNLAQGRWRHYTRADGLPHLTVRDLVWARFRGRDALMAATHGGVVRFVNGRWHPLGTGAQDLGTPRGLLYTPGREGGHLWVATSRGLVAWDGGRWTSYGTSVGLPHPSVRCLAELTEENGPIGILAGTDAGLALLKAGRFSPIPLPEAIAKAGLSALIWCEVPGEGRCLLAGSYGGGLILLRRGPQGWTSRLLALGEDAPRGGDVVLSLQKDQSGRVYAGTSRGILRLRFNAGGSFLLERYGDEDGLPGRECTQGRGTCDGTGRVWVGTASGAVCLDPAGDLIDRTQKPLRMLGVQVQGVDAPVWAGQALEPGVGRVDFDFSLVSHHREGDSRYRSQLLGLESTPTEWDRSGKREFTSLPHGPYVFRVWGRDFNGNLSGPVDFPFSVRPHWWQTWWSRLLVVLGFSAVIMGGFRWRSRLLVQRNEALEGLVRRRTSEVTAQKEALQKMTEDLAHLNQQKSEFLGMVAHDLRNPLGQISLSAELALELEDVRTSRKTLGQIRETVGHMGELISAVLNKDALESGRLSLRREAMPLGPILHTCAHAFEQRAAQKGQRVNLVVPGDLHVWGDPDRFREVLENLISNALKFSPPDRTVWIRTERAESWVRVRVADQGPGIPPEERDRLFEPHARLSPRPTGGEPSTGLGLFIAKRMVEAMGGTLRLECPPSGGAEFVVELPYSD
jgi:signal transduction histidine kinase/ligand-binding sensor domain-containing protein